jgi:hypothetical protein
MTYKVDKNGNYLKTASNNHFTVTQFIDTSGKDVSYKTSFFNKKTNKHLFSFTTTNSGYPASMQWEADKICSKQIISLIDELENISKLFAKISNWEPTNNTFASFEVRSMARPILYTCNVILADNIDLHSLLVVKTTSTREEILGYAWRELMLHDREPLSNQRSREYMPYQVASLELIANVAKGKLLDLRKDLLSLLNDY